MVQRLGISSAGFTHPQRPLHVQHFTRHTPVLRFLRLRGGALRCRSRWRASRRVALEQARGRADPYGTQLRVGPGPADS